MPSSSSRNGLRLALGAGIAALAVGAVAVLVPRLGSDRGEIDALVAKNVAARGGEAAWRAVTALRLTGAMDIGQGLQVPYVLEQQRPDRMCLSFTFDGADAVQCVDGGSGWTIAPYRGITEPRPMTADELREVADLADPYGLLFDYRRRGHDLALVGPASIAGRDAVELEVTLPAGAVRWVYLDAETGLELQMDAVRTVNGHDQKVSTAFQDWVTSDGLTIARRQETRIEGGAPHALTVTSVHVNPELDPERFRIPGDAAQQGGCSR